MGYTLSRRAEEDIVDIYLAGAERFGIHQAERSHALLEKVLSFWPITRWPLASATRLCPRCVSTRLDHTSSSIGSIKRMVSSSFAFAMLMNIGKASRIRHNLTGVGANRDGRLGEPAFDCMSGG